MSFKLIHAQHSNFILLIEEDYPEVGAYLYVYEGKVCIKDFLQNDIEACKALAYEEYQVPLNSWLEKEKA